jgi:propionyl-CoA carboxylase alpha chain
MLREETRLKMVEQVKALVRKVGYTSAGTVEFLVDEDQNFYFLEMNTRLQVEHPVTELVSGNIDLVKAMLWVGAGWGIPEDLMAVLGDSPYYPHFGHAVEARIYAEDPVRGFLPSTGPLLPYQEPPHVRVDSGVAEGHVVSPHYDPMLSKVIACKDTRLEAIDALSQAMDEYVIGDKIQHNARLVNDVLRSEAFRSGHTPTSFLETHYGPGGFQGVQLSHTERLELAVSVAWIDEKRRTHLGVASSGETVVVRLGGMFGDAILVQMNHAIKLAHAFIICDTMGLESSFRLDSAEYQVTDLIAKVSLDGQSRSIQVLKERTTGELQIQMYGALVEVLLQTPREYELSRHMQPPVEVDTSNMVLSPMPGTLISYAVREGDTVLVGQELCVVEAMKMQNIIRSPRSGTIGALKVNVGSPVKSDELILEFSLPDEEPQAA